MARCLGMNSIQRSGLVEPSQLQCSSGEMHSEALEVTTSHGGNAVDRVVSPGKKGN